MQRKEDLSLGDLFAQLAKEVSTLVRQEAHLARVEMSQKVSGVARDVGMLAIGGLVAYAGLLAIVAAAVVGLAEAGLALWLSALIVGLAVAGIGYFLVRQSLDNLKKGDLAPRHTLESLKEDGEWAKNQVK